MKIAILTDGVYPYVIGGMQKHSFYLTRFLSDLGADITLYHCVSKGEKIPSEEQVKEDLKISNESFKSVCLEFPQAGHLPGHYIKENYFYSTQMGEGH